MRRYLFSGYFRRKKNKAGWRVYTLHSLFYMEVKRTRFVEFSDNDIKKLVANAVLESIKRRPL